MIEAPVSRALKLNPALGRVVRLVSIAVAISAAGLATFFYFADFLSPTMQPLLGADLSLYREATQRWLAGGPFYLPYQLVGPYAVGTSDILYPPVTAVLLFIPSLALPTPLWWVVPLAVIAIVVAHHRPAPWALALIALSLAFAPTVQLIAAGNPAMWIAAAMAVGTIWRPASAFILLKPSVIPLALFGIRDRRWWLIVGAICVISLLLLPMDLDWLSAVLNAGGDRSGILYSLRDVPFISIGLVAWLGRRRPVGFEGGMELTDRAETAP